MTFDSFNLHPHIMTGVRALGYKTPSPIQEKAIPVILEGRDVMGLAQTGTGKTAAFVLPILQRLMDGPRGRIRSLIITPTRELAQQIHDAIGELGKDCGLRSVALYGGMSIYSQIHKLRKGVEIVVACPGRLLDHVDQGTINLKHLEVLVLDEADQMFDMGFLPNIRKILQLIPKKRQSLLFSATMPKDVRHLAEEVLHNPETIQIGHSAPTKTVTQALFPVAPHLKTDLLIKILQTTDANSVLVFTRTKHRAQKLSEQLGRAGYTVASLQGNLSQAKRQAAMTDFRKGKIQILVATDIASRGIDVANISHVINYDMPQTVEAYTHRIGRTGRAAKLGDAFTLLTKEDFPRVRAIERILGTKLEQRTLEDFDYKAKTPFDPVPVEHAYQERDGENKSFKRNRSEKFSDRKDKKFSFDAKPKKHRDEKSSTDFEGRRKERDFSHSKPRKDDQGFKKKSSSHSHFSERPRNDEKRKERSRFADSPRSDRGESNFKHKSSAAHFGEKTRTDDRRKSRFGDSPRSDRGESHFKRKSSTTNFGEKTRNDDHRKSRFADSPRGDRGKSDFKPRSSASHFGEKTRTDDRRKSRFGDSPRSDRGESQFKRKTSHFSDRSPKGENEGRSRFKDSYRSNTGDQPHKRKSPHAGFSERSRTDERRGAPSRSPKKFGDRNSSTRHSHKGRSSKPRFRD